MKTTTKIIISGAAALTAVSGMGVAAFAVTEADSKEVAETVISEQTTAIASLQQQILEAEAALAAAQANYDAAIAALNSGSTSSGSVSTGGSQTGAGATGGTSAAPAPAPAPAPAQSYDDDNHEEHDDDHEERDDDHEERDDDD